ncbi:hypothetical protein I5S60_06190 [Pseudomonas fluorescens]|nr:hypothetical protein [Pseudomonas fluorescens]
MFEVNASINGWEVVGSGFLHISGTFARIVFDGMPIEIKFESDGDSVRYDFTPSDKDMTLTLYNFDSQAPQGKIEPVVMAASGGRDIKMTFIVQTLNKELNLRIFSYTFLLEPESHG